MTTPNDGSQAEVAHLRAALLTKTMLCDMLCEDITDLRKRSWEIAAEAWKQRDEARAGVKRLSCIVSAQQRLIDEYETEFDVDDFPECDVPPGIVSARADVEKSRTT